MKFKISKGSIIEIVANFFDGIFLVKEINNDTSE
jgi:hypothetical protein